LYETEKDGNLLGLQKRVGIAHVSLRPWLWLIACYCGGH